MWSPGFFTPGPEERDEFDDTTENGEGFIENFAQNFTHFQGDHANPTQRSTIVAHQGIPLVAPSYFPPGQGFINRVAIPVAPTPNYISGPDHYPLQWPLPTFPYPPYNAPATDGDYVNSEVNASLPWPGNRFSLVPSTGVPAFDNVGRPLDGRNLQHIDQTGNQARSSTTTQDLTHEPFYPREGESPHLSGGAYPQPPTTLLSHPPLNTIAEANWMAIDETGPPEDAVASVPALPHEVGNEETLEPFAGSPTSETSNAGSSDPRKRTRVPTKRKTQRSEENGHELLDPQPGPIQVTLSFLPGRPGLLALRQILYQSGNPPKPYTKLPDIYFTVDNKEGIKLTDAMDIHFSGPDDRDQFMFTDGDVKKTISLRIIFEGFGAWARAKQIATKNYRTKQAPVTKKELGRGVARLVRTYLDDLQHAGRPYRVSFEDMFLVRLIHVAQASWQAEIWYQVRVPDSAST